MDRKHFFSNLFISQASVEFSILDYIILAGLLICFIPSTIKLSATVNDNLISVRKRYWSIFWFFVSAVFISIVSWFDGIYNPVYLIIGSTIVVTYYLSALKRPFWQEITLSVITLLILANNYYSLLLGYLGEN